MQGFKGVDYSTGARDSGPVQFERQPEHDPFDLEKHVNEVRGGHKNALDAIGSRGTSCLTSLLDFSKHQTSKRACFS